MSENIPIHFPAHYAPGIALGYADESGCLSLVETGRPLPVVARRETVAVPLAGESSEPTVVGPYVPVRDAPVHLELRGEWSGQVALQRSSDGGTTRSGVTVGGVPWATFAGNANEIVWQEGEQGALLYLDIAVTSGTVSYRLSQ